MLCLKDHLCLQSEAGFSPGPHPDEECYLVMMPRDRSAVLLIGRAGERFPRSISIFSLKKIKEKIPLCLFINNICLQSSRDQKQTLKGVARNKILKAV